MVVAGECIGSEDERGEGVDSGAADGARNTHQHHLFPG